MDFFIFFCVFLFLVLLFSACMIYLYSVIRRSEGDRKKSGDEDPQVTMAANTASACSFQFIPVLPGMQEYWEEEPQEDAEGFWISQEVFQRTVPASALEVIELETVVPPQVTGGDEVNALTISPLQETGVDVQSPEVSALTSLPLQESVVDEQDEVSALPLQVGSASSVPVVGRRKKKRSLRKRLRAFFSCCCCKVEE